MVNRKPDNWYTVILKGQAYKGFIDQVYEEESLSIFFYIYCILYIILLLIKHYSYFLESQHACCYR